MSYTAERSKHPRQIPTSSRALVLRRRQRLLQLLERPFVRGVPISTGEHVSGSVVRVQRRSMDSDCKSLYCLPKYCLCGSSLRTSNTGSPNTHCPGLTKSPRNTEPRLLRVRERSLWTQELPQPPKSCVSSSFNLHAELSNNTKDVVAISFLKHPRQIRTPLTSARLGDRLS
jgi:hypothetical protein